jgi:hypothetical protein
LKTRSEIVRYEPPREFEVDVVGDLIGHGVWTLTERAVEGLEPYARSERPRAPNPPAA